MNNTKCFHCLKDIKVADSDYQMVALEVPYVNLFFHRGCIREIPDLIQYLTDAVDKINSYR